MKRITVSLMAILTVAFLSLPAFAANQIERNSLSAEGDSNRIVTQNQTLVGGDGSAIFARNQGSDESYGLPLAWNDRKGSSLEMRIENPTLVGGDGSGVFTGSQSSDENYGLAPAWNNKGNASEKRMENPTLQGIFDNIGS